MCPVQCVTYVSGRSCPCTKNLSFNMRNAHGIRGDKILSFIGAYRVQCDGHPRNIVAVSVIRSKLIGDACAEVMLLPCPGSEDGKGSFPRKPLEVRLPLQAQVVLARFHVDPYAKCRVAHFACSLFENLAYKDHGFTGYGLRNGRA